MITIQKIFRDVRIIILTGNISGAKGNGSLARYHYRLSFRVVGIIKGARLFYDYAIIALLAPPPLPQTFTVEQQRHRHNRHKYGSGLL